MLCYEDMFEGFAAAEHAATDMPASTNVSTIIDGPEFVIFYNIMCLARR